jgi:signal transduction histidine kinase
LPVVERQTGVGISYEKSGAGFAVSGDAAVHVYRVLQEALNNVARHSGAKQAWVRLQFGLEGLVLEIEDHGSGFAVARERRGIGMVAMRERAELLGGKIAFERPAEGGALVRLTVPRESAPKDGAGKDVPEPRSPGSSS